MKEKTDSVNHEKESAESRQKIEEEQIFMNELKRELKNEMVGEGLFILVMYLFFADIDL